MADTKQQWYKDAKYGLFIHWGLYSILAGEWKDPKTGEVTKTDRIAEWIENNLNIDKEDYRKLKDEFHPDKFDADMFVKRAKEQWGVKYIVLTSKHHEGFAMYDSIRNGKREFRILHGRQHSLTALKEPMVFRGPLISSVSTTTKITLIRLA